MGYNQNSVPFLFAKRLVTKELRSSQKQALTNFLEEKNRKNWRQKFHFNTDVKLIFKALKKRFKKLLFSFISPNQTANLDNRYMIKGGLLISDILDVTNTLKFKGFLLAVNLEKDFDSVNYLSISNISKFMC